MKPTYLFALAVALLGGLGYIFFRSTGDSPALDFLIAFAPSAIICLAASIDRPRKN